jgi:hypothetical protein
MTTRLNEKENQNRYITSFILSSPVNRWLATPDRLYRMMQCRHRADSELKAEFEDD